MIMGNIHRPDDPMKLAFKKPQRGLSAAHFPTSSSSTLRILIATVTAGSGHLQAAIALEEAWRVVRPTDPVEHLDALDFAPRLYKKIYEKGYPKLVSHAPEVYGLAFRKTDNPARVKKLTRLRRTFAKLTTQPFVDRLLASRPDAVICTHYLPLVILGGLKNKAPGW